MTGAEVVGHPGSSVAPTYLDYGADPLKVTHDAGPLQKADEI